MEIWKDIEGYEGLYQVSNLGQVKSLERYTPQQKLLPERLLKQSDSRGYKRVNLSKNGKRKTFPIHRLVALAFIPNPENKPTVNHLDEIKTNNHVENLEWATAAEQNSHGSRLQRCSESMKVSEKWKEGFKITVEKQSKPIVAFNGEHVIYYKSIAEAQRTDFKNAHISDCCSGKRNKTHGFRFCFVENLPTGLIAK